MHGGVSRWGGPYASPASRSENACLGSPSAIQVWAAMGTGAGRGPSVKAGHPRVKDPDSYCRLWTQHRGSRGSRAGPTVTCPRTRPGQAPDSQIHPYRWP